MSKRLFRRKAPLKQSQPLYPTLDDFDRGRRRFLALLGAGALGTALSRCSNRAVTLEESDGGVDGNPLLPDGSLSRPDLEHTPQGRYPPTPTQLDSGVPDQEPDWEIDGNVMPPDASIDQQVKLDWGLSGYAPAPDAKIDEPDLEFTMGEAPAMGAPIDRIEKKGGLGAP